MKKLSYILSSILFLCLTACQDDLSGVPSAETKAAGFEPDSYSFSNATVILPGTRGFSASVYSQVPAGKTRYYRINLPNHKIGDSEYSLKNAAILEGGLPISLYDPDYNLLETSMDNVSFNDLKSYYPEDCYSCELPFYLAIENDTEEEIKYGFGFNWGY